MSLNIPATSSIAKNVPYSLDIRSQIAMLRSGRIDAQLLAAVLDQVQSSVNGIESAVRESIGQTVPPGAVEGSVLVNFQKKSVWQSPLLVVQESTLTANTTFTGPVAAARQRLLLYIFQDATTEYVPSFDPLYFVDSPNVHIDLSMAAVREYFGRADGKWYPIGPWQNFDPSI